MIQSGTAAVIGTLSKGAASNPPMGKERVFIMDQIAVWFASTLGKYISAKAVVFIISMVPILELIRCLSI